MLDNLDEPIQNEHFEGEETMGRPIEAGVEQLD